MSEQSEPIVIPARYPQLYIAIRETVKDMLVLLKAVLANTPKWPTRQGQRIIFGENGSHTEDSVEEFPRDALGQVYGDLQARDSFGAALRELEPLAAAGRAIPSYLGLAQGFVAPILADYLDKDRSLAFNQDSFKRAYYPVEEYIAGEGAMCRLYLELRGLKGTVEEIVLSGTHRIRRLDAQEINRLWRVIAPPGTPSQLAWRMGPWHWPALGTYVLEADITYGKSDAGKIGVFLTEEETRTIRALRLSACGSGPIHRLTYEDLGFCPSMGRFGAPETNRGGSYAYELTPEIADTVKSHWSDAFELSSLLDSRDKLPRPMRICALRFCASFDKDSKEDQLIDYSIGFEALFTKENDAISYRLPLRAAIFTGDTPKERENIFWTVKRSYDLRSDLAHGQNQLEETVKVRNAKIPLADFMAELRSVQFKSLHHFLRSLKKASKETLLRAIDDAAISMDRSDLAQIW